MSQTPQTLNILNNKGSLNFDFNGNFDCIATNYIINSSDAYICEINNNITTQSRNGNINVITDVGIIKIDSYANNSNAIVINASHSNGGIYTTTGSGGYDVVSTSGNIALLSRGSNINIGVSSVGTAANLQTQNVNIESFNSMTMNSGDMYFVSSDVISFISSTGDIQFGTSTNNLPSLKFSDGNVLINQVSSNLDYQLDIAITDESNNITKKGYNGLIINSLMSNVASDLTLQTSNTLGDGTQCILSLGSFGSNNPQAIYQKYLAYQTGTSVIKLDGPEYSPNNNDTGFGNEFTYPDIGRILYWPGTNRQNTILSLATYISTTSDTSNVSVSGTYTGTISRIYLIQIDNITTPNTFKWSNNGGTTFQRQFIPIVLSPISLEYGLSILFTVASGFAIKQQFTFHTKIIAVVSDSIVLVGTPIPELIYSLQPYYSYINTITPSDIVIKTNNNEKLRITGDGSIGIQKQLPTACLDLNSNYNKIMIVNEIITGYQVNPNITHLNSGGYVIVWNSQDNLSGASLIFDVYGQRYLSDGVPYGSNFKINITTAYNQSYPSVAGNRLKNSNHYIVAWSSLDNTNNVYKVYCQIYINNIPIRSFDIQIDATNATTSNQLFPRVAGLYNGNYIIVWNADDTGGGSGIYSVKGLIINDAGTIVYNKFNISSTSNIYSASFAYVAGLPNNDITVPNGFVVGYMTAVNNNADPRYNISLRIMNEIGTPYSNEIAITSGNNELSSISDGLVSVAEINLQQASEIPNNGNGGFIISFYRNYQADTSLYAIGDNVSGLLSGATASISAIDGINRIITLQNVSNRFLISEEIKIVSSVPNAGHIIEKVSNVIFLTTTTANITLDTGSKNVVAYRFNSNMTQTSDAVWTTQINTTSLYTDTDAISGNPNIFKYKRALSAVSIDNLGTACITWSNGSIPSVYYQLIDITNGAFINTEQRIISKYAGIKQRDQVITHLQSIEGNDYGFVISWDNQSLDLLDTAIYQQLIGYNHSLLNLEDGNSNFSFNHKNQCGVGTNLPNGNLHIQSQNTTEYNDPVNTTSVILQNTSKHIITNSNTGMHNIIFKNGDSNVLNIIKSSNSLRYDDLYPLPENLIGFYKFDETQGTQSKDSSAASTYLSGNLPVYVNTSAILLNFDIENCWSAGLINNSLLFNGHNNYLFIENTSPNNLNTVLETAKQLSISIWVNIPINVIDNSTYDIISNGGALTIAGTYIISVSDVLTGDGTLLPVVLATVNNGAALNTITLTATNTSGSIINDAKWRNITTTFFVASGTGTCTIKLYIDGILNNSITEPGTLDSVEHGTYKTYIGSRNGTSNGFFRGYMDEMRIYNTVLTDELILQLYNYGNPNIVPKGSLFINANDSTSHNLGIVLDDTGKLNNLNTRPLPYSILSGDFVAYSSNTTISGIGTLFTTQLTIGDIITLDIAQNNVTEFAVVSISSDILLTLDRRGYGGPEISKSYQTVLRRPSIITFFDNGDNMKGNIDNYGNLIIGNGKASSMLEICGTSSNTKNIPHLTLTNTSIEHTMYSRKTAINFQSNDMIDNLDPHITLCHIESGHDGNAEDNKGIMRFFTNNGTQENNIMSLTSSGYIGFGNQNTPLSIIHTTSTDTSNDCMQILQSNYNNSNISSIFDERSSIVFAGLTSITNTLDTNIRKKVLSGISGSNDSNSKILNGRLDFSTNNDDNAIKNGIEARMCILHTGNVGVNIISPSNLLCVAPELRVANGTINTITSTSFGTGLTTFTISNNIFENTTETNNLLIGGTFIINNTILTQGTITAITAINQFRAPGDYTAWNNYTIYIHRAGLNVNATGYTGINTKTMNSSLTINGSVSGAITNINSNITLDSSHYTIIGNTSSNSITITLPINTNIKGRIYIIKNTNVNNIIVSGNSSLIDGLSSYTIVGGGSKLSKTFQSDGTNWWITG